MKKKLQLPIAIVISMLEPVFCHTILCSEPFGDNEDADFIS